MQENLMITLSPPRFSDEIRQQIKELSEIKRASEEYGFPDFASKMAWKSLLAHEEELKIELQAAVLLESKADAEIVIEGDPVQNHAVYADFLGDILKAIQDIINSTAQVLTSEPTSRAAIPRNIVAENRLLVLPEFLPGSFALRLKLPTKEELVQLYDTYSQVVLDRVCNLLHQQTPNDEAINLLSHSRLKKHYSDFMELLAKRNANIRIRNRMNPYGIKVTSSQARDLVDWLKLLEFKDEEISYTGVLSGGSIESGRFELKIGEDIFKGSVSEKAKNEMKQFKFGDIVNAIVRITTAYHEDKISEPTTRYFLVSLSSPNLEP